MNALGCAADPGLINELRQCDQKVLPVWPQSAGEMTDNAADGVERKKQSMYVGYNGALTFSWWFDPSV